MKLVIWIFGVIVGVLLWWGLTFIPSVSNFNDLTHGKSVEQTQPENEIAHEETPLRVFVE